MGLLEALQGVLRERTEVIRLLPGTAIPEPRYPESLAIEELLQLAHLRVLDTEVQVLGEARLIGAHIKKEWCWVDATIQAILIVHYLEVIAIYLEDA